MKKYNALIICTRLASIDKGIKKSIIKLILYSVLSGVLDVISIGLVIPLVQLVAGDGKKLNLYLEKYSIIVSTEYAIGTLTLIFLAVLLISMGMRVYLIKEISKSVFKIGNKLSGKIFNNLVYQRVSYFKQIKSSDALIGLSKRVDDALYQGIIPIVLVISNTILLATLILSALLYDFKLTVAVFFSLVVIYACITIYTKNKLLLLSEILDTNGRKIISHAQSTFFRIKEILLNNEQEIASDKYKKLDAEMREAQVVSFNYSASPRIIIETFGMIIIAGVAYLGRGDVQLVGVLAALALLIQKLMPLAQQIYVAILNIKGGDASLKIITELLCLEPKEIYRDDFYSKFDSLELKNVSFSYDENLLDNINIRIANGEKVAIIGRSGSGKTTLIEIMIGLLKPTAGMVCINNQINPYYNSAWFDSISYISQNCHISDGTILSNIIGESVCDQDDRKLNNSIINSGVAQFIGNLKDGLMYKVGENGVKLSGGQRQRLAIAKALYRESDVIFFDEPTSSLDAESSSVVFEFIKSDMHNHTVILITHDTNALEYFDSVYELKCGTLKKYEPPQDN